jgi:hypothetical protein
MREDAIKVREAALEERERALQAREAALYAPRPASRGTKSRRRHRLTPLYAYALLLQHAEVPRAPFRYCVTENA